ncbi:unnamed protein product [Chilo suppressalis]|uniref:4-coumarate--CoA ligase 1-like n=1 Tax=Chilo suppressalis TaxID=168631 RepID=A0ABN8B2U1_CHISP|nr:unnamed protein product [Chilo suppressalis]
MQATRKILLAQIKNIKWQRSLSRSAIVFNNDFEIKSPLADIVMPNTTFLDRLWRDKSKFKSLVALESAETKKSYTYDQLSKNMAAFATSLHKKLGLKSGDVVAIMLPNSPEFVVVAFGSLQAGCVVTTLNPIYKEHEVQHQSKITQPKVFVTIPTLYETVLKGLKSAQIEAKIIVVDNANEPIPDGTVRYTEIAENSDADYSILDNVHKEDDDVAFIPFSSGTTGLPKGVEITYKNLKASIEIMSNEKNCFAKMSEGSFQDVVPCILPFFHIYGLVVTLIGHITKGCKLITMSSFSATLYLNLLQNEKASLLYVVPPIAILLGKHPDVNRQHFRNVRHIVCGAAPLAASDVQNILEKAKTKLEVNQGFGATETSSLTTATFIGQNSYDYDSCGDIMASITVKYVDPMTGDPVPVGQKGEMCVKGPIVMKGYHKNEEATRECLTEDGYFKTGDLGYYKPGVGAYITDRIKELIKVKGLQVAPAELESVLRTHPAIQEAAVIGVPHEFFGEVPKAFVVLKNEFKVSPEEIQEYVATKVAPFKKIEEVMMVDNIPKNLTGKILRRELKKMYA